MLCSIIRFDPRFIEYDLDVIAGLHYEVSKDGICTRLDVFPCSSNIPKYSELSRETILKCPLIVIPSSMTDVLLGTVNIGEVYADIERVGDFWWWIVDTSMAKLVIQELYIRLRYIKEMV